MRVGKSGWSAHPALSVWAAAGRAHSSVAQRREGFLDAGNSYAQLRLEELFAVGPDVFRDSRLLLGSGSLWWFLPLCTAAFLAARQAGIRAGILFGVLFVLSYMFLTAVFDENEYLRHGMAARALVNVLTVAGTGIVLRRAAGAVGALSRMRGGSVSSTS
jgi:hypothetical protein